MSHDAAIELDSAPAGTAEQAASGSYDLQPVVEWLLTDARLANRPVEDLMAEFAHKLKLTGLPVDRVTLHIQSLHPLFIASSLTWTEDEGALEMTRDRSVRNEEAFLRSPIKPIFEGKGAMHLRIDEGHCKTYPILSELAECGFRDYAIYPIPFGRGIVNAASFATRERTGFSPQDLAAFAGIIPAFAAVVELRQNWRTASDLMETYVGRLSGEKVLQGAITRGDAESLYAVVWNSDLRDFTAFSEKAPKERVLAFLNDYFDCIAGAIEPLGGEILKFIGDGVLAIFPCQALDNPACDAAQRALAAAHKALAALEAHNAALPPDIPHLHCGIGLHVGWVNYGNIGARHRLDFTVIGPAVNKAARIEGLCRKLGREILVTSDFARLNGGSFESLGCFELKGIAEPVEVLSPSA